MREGYKRGSLTQENGKWDPIEPNTQTTMLATAEEVAAYLRVSRQMVTRVGQRWAISRLGV
jgi:hypothetical protein